MEQVPRLLLVDHDPVRCRVLGDYLREQGFDTIVAADCETALRLVAEDGCDLVILDDMLPGLGCIEALRRIRRQGELPVVILSARNDDVDRIVGIELGADDYLPKSCNLRELTARLRSILRRSRHAVAAENLRKNAIGSLVISPGERKATWRGKALPLTSTEFDLLERLHNNPGRAMDKSLLARKVLGRELMAGDRSIDMHIGNLRKKLGKLGDGRSPIQTVRGAGYQLLRK
jgi:DNA-binding response OmpR family regulator